MKEETCLKCGHVNPAATGLETEACPQCGAIYSRVKAVMAAAQARAAGGSDSRPGANALDQVSRSKQPARSKPAARPSVYVGQSRAPYIQQLRDDTNYPTFRAVVRIGLYFGYLLAALALIGGCVAAFRTEGSAWYLLIGAGMGAALYLLTRIWFELTVMIVDIADSSVRTAENSDPRAND